MDKHSVVKLKFASSLTDICKGNSSFDKGVLRVAYTGENRNGSFISQDSFERAIPSMYNCPVVANYSIEEDKIGSHDIGLVKDTKGDIKLINFTEPLGVIPESAKVWFDDVEEEDGTIHNYLFTEVLLWKRQAVYPKIVNDGIVSHSMEIQVKNGHSDGDIYVIDDFEFTAFCLLGDDEPCFESSALEVFSLEGFKAQMAEMMRDLKEEFTLVSTSSDDDNKHPQKYSTEGGETVLDVKLELAEKYGIDLDSIDFSIDELSAEELEQKFVEMTSASDNVDAQADAHDGDAIDDSGEDVAAEDGIEGSESYALVGGVIDEIRRQLATDKIETSWGIEPRYCYIDCDTDAHEVYAYDINDWLVYGFAYSQSGDAITIDFDSKKRKKFIIVDFEGDDTTSQIASIFEKVDCVIKDNAEWEAKYNTASDTIVSMEAELKALREYKNGIEANVRNEQVEKLFSEFDDIADTEAFAELKNGCDLMELDMIEEKLYAIRGRCAVRTKFSLKKSAEPKLPVSPTSVDDAGEHKEPYGGIVKKYLNK